MLEEHPHARLRDAARRGVVGGLAVRVLTVAQLARQPGAHTWDTMWAEDGRVYASDALATSWVHSLFRGYAGYVQLVPRLLALPLRLIPPKWWAAWFAFSAALLTALLALFIYHAMASFLSSRPLRALLAVTSALAPAMWFEVNANIANLGWPLLFAAFWAVLDRRTTFGALVARSLVLAGAALTSTLAVLYLPLAVVVTWRRRRTRRELYVTGAFVFAVIAQAVADRFATPGFEGPSSVGDLTKIYLVRVVGSATVGERALQTLWLSWHLWLAVAFGLALIAVLVVGHRAERGQRRLMWLVVAASVVLFAAPVWIRG